MTTETSLETQRALAVGILQQFLADNPKYTGDAFACTHEKWLSRGELYGQNSLATLVVDGSPLYAALNGYNSNTAIIAKLDKVLADSGFYLEGGYAWAWHVYNT